MYKISKKQLIYATNVMKSWCEANDLLSPIYTTVARGGGVGFATINLSINCDYCAKIILICGN